MATQSGSVNEPQSECDGNAQTGARAGADIFARHEPVPCPYCKSTHTECLALFGPVLLTSQYYCKQCHSAFEVVKD